MPQPQRKGSISLTDLPNPELNPLLNPTLGKNLGRWAEVYFTSPPEKREEAVEELLRELQGDSSGIPVTADDPTAEMSVAPRAESPAYTRVCEKCSQGYTAPQRYCGMCGGALLASDEFENDPVPGSMPAQNTTETIPLRYAPTASLLGLDEQAIETTRPDATDSEDASDIRWLRDKRLFSGDESEGRGASTVRRFAPALLALLAIAALFYAQWRPKTIARQTAQPTSTATTQERAPAPEALASPVDTSKQSSPMTSQQAAQQVVQPRTPPVEATAPAERSLSDSMAKKSEVAGKNPATQAAAPQPAAKSPEPLDAPVATSDFGNGAAELAQAENYLNGKNGARDTAAAARLLWQAVGKENTSAILLLSNMYLIGEGVPKNCDQARVLLYAAARKHVIQAADKLRDLERSGCP